MVWIPFFSSNSNPSPKSNDGGRIAPDRSSRQRCYEARDTFFACLDRNAILDSVKEDNQARKKCADEIREFEGVCSGAWSKYFKEKRVMEYNRDKKIEQVKMEDQQARDQAQQGWGSR